MNSRFTMRICRRRNSALSGLNFAAYLTDNKHGVKFSNTFATREQAQAWADNAIALLINR